MKVEFIYKGKLYGFRSVEPNAPPLDIEMALEMIDEGLVIPMEGPPPKNQAEVRAAYLRNFERRTGKPSRLAVSVAN